ncbi:MAG: hypothetical protein H6822_19685 [Planctomycetaceae bacterium]|nr:hypothetical protein [Planctomycetaceae bacterium]
MAWRPGTNPRAFLNYARWHYRRPVDWRWQRAQRLVRDGKWPIAGADGPWGVETYRYADARRSLFGKYYFTDRMIDLHAAYKLSNDDSPRRWELEARILARENINRVAEKTGIAVSTIEAFAAAFFHVWPRIDARDYIHSVVIDSRRPWTPTRVRDLWCYFGYSGGPLVLDAIIQHYKQSGQADYSYLMEPLGPKRDQSEPGRSINSVLRLMFLERTDKNLKTLAEMNAIVAATETELAVPLAEDAFDSSFKQAIDASLGSVPMLKGSKTTLDQVGAA